jgi:hypothetical protein
VVVLLCILALAASLAYLTLSGESAVASEMESIPVASTGMRQFYQTKGQYDGSEASTACEEGYHMASLWEIADPSNLKYNTALGISWQDSGSGPPAIDYGWVRTGYVNYTSYGAGEANCDAWSSDSYSHWGTVVVLPWDWTAEWDDMNVWTASVIECGYSQFVWCIED